MGGKKLNSGREYIYFTMFTNIIKTTICFLDNGHGGDLKEDQVHNHHFIGLSATRGAIIGLGICLVIWIVIAVISFAVFKN